MIATNHSRVLYSIMQYSIMQISISCVSFQRSEMVFARESLRDGGSRSYPA
jgi:hypothetical protein